MVQDYLTKGPEAFILKNIEAETIARQLVDDVISRFGGPRIILTDQLRHFESILMTELRTLL